MRRFTHRANEQQERNEVRGIPLGPKERQLRFGQCGRGGENVIKPDRIR